MPDEFQSSAHNSKKSLVEAHNIDTTATHTLTWKNSNVAGKKKTNLNKTRRQYFDIICVYDHS